ncbi:MAG: hypothetical protein LUD52_07335 [Opitutae bacterium]|nr:hypothetical protein [Opitutae bacterium]
MWAPYFVAFRRRGKHWIMCVSYFVLSICGLCSGGTKPKKGAAMKTEKRIVRKSKSLGTGEKCAILPRNGATIVAKT